MSTALAKIEPRASAPAVTDTAPHGSIPRGLCVLHRCDNRLCVNPAHLFAGSHAENMADMKAKGRAVGHKGERNPRAILSRGDVLEIRRAIGAGVPQERLALAFGVSKSTVNAIHLKRIWREV